MDYLSVVAVGAYDSLDTNGPAHTPSVFPPQAFLPSFCGFVMLPKKHTLNFKLNTMIETQNQVQIDDRNGNSTKPLLPAVAWEAIADDDFVFRFGDYCLRVEQMNKRYWWWCVYYQDEYAGFDEPKAKTKLEAKLLAEICFVRHWSSHSR